MVNIKKINSYNDQFVRLIEKNFHFSLCFLSSFSVIRPNRIENSTFVLTQGCFDYGQGHIDRHEAYLG
jgi:hypothetical protein